MQYFTHCKGAGFEERAVAGLQAHRGMHQLVDQDGGHLDGFGHGRGDKDLEMAVRGRAGVPALADTGPPGSAPGPAAGKADIKR